MSNLSSCSKTSRSAGNYFPTLRKVTSLTLIIPFLKPQTPAFDVQRLPMCWFPLFAPLSFFFHHILLLQLYHSRSVISELCFGNGRSGKGQTGGCSHCSLEKIWGHPGKKFKQSCGWVDKRKETRREASLYDRAIAGGDVSSEKEQRKKI